MTTITSLGVQPGIVTIVICFVVFTAIATALFLVWRKAEDDSNAAFLSGIFGWIFSVFAAFSLLFSISSLVPFDSKYYDYYSVEGVVDEVSNTFESGSGDSTTATFVVTFEGDKRPYALTDPRIVSLDGTKVELLCTSSWVYQAADKWNCEIRDAGY